MIHSIEGKKLSLYVLYKLTKIDNRRNSVIGKGVSQEAPEPNHFPGISPKLGEDHSELSYVRRLISYKAQRSVHASRHVSPQEAFRTPRAVRSYGTIFLIVETSKLNKLMA